jgi:hypothetical protein
MNAHCLFDLLDLLSNDAARGIVGSLMIRQLVDFAEDHSTDVPLSWGGVNLR